MKIAMINALDCGSTGKIMLNIARTASQNDMETYTFSSSRAAKGTASKNHIYIDKYIVYRSNMAVSMFSGYELNNSYIATKKMIKRLKEIKPDIIHLHNTHGFYLNHRLLFNYIKKNDIKLVWTLHDCWTFTGRCPYFQLTKCEKWKTGCSECIYPKGNYPASYCFDRSKHNYNLKKKYFCNVKDMTIVTPSEWLADLVKQSYMSSYPVQVINNGIDLSLYKPTESDFRTQNHLEDKYIILGVAASWGERKGLDVFCELAKRLDSKYQIVLVGTNENVDKQLSDNIISIHRTHNQEELAKIYTAADVFFNPTREDNYPTVNMEAIACGTPVITFDTGGSPEMVDENTGIVIPQNDIDEAERTIKMVCEKKPFTKEMCLKKAQSFDMNEKFMEYVKLYERQFFNKRDSSHIQS